MNNQIPVDESSNPKTPNESVLLKEDNNINTPKTISADEIKKDVFQLDKKNKEQEKQKQKELKKSLKRKKEKQKTDYINILLVLAICFLLLIIILPPTLRKIMPKTTIVENEKNSSALILACTGINKKEYYKITSRTKYIDNKPTQNIITYNKIAPSSLEENNYISTTPTSPTEEINYFKTIRNIIIDTNNATTIVSIYDYAVEKNTGNFRLMNYFQDIDNQKNFYENQGYTCETIKN
ncbi:MAG: hypothetical protein PUC82_02480 [bacterium]|nr:hypothetical protein [bacterium]